MKSHNVMRTLQAYFGSAVPIPHTWRRTGFGSTNKLLFLVFCLFVLSIATQAQTYIETSVIQGGESYEGPNCMASYNGETYMFGSTGSADFPVTTSAIYAGDSDGFLVRFDADGNIVSSTLIGGSGQEIIRDMSITNGIVHLVGTTSSPDFPTTDGTSFSGARDAFYVQTDLAGNVLYSTLIGGTGDESKVFVESDGSDAHIIVNTSSSDALVTDGSALSGASDLLYLNYSTGATLQHAGYLGGSGTDRADQLVLDSGLLYISGTTNSSDLPTTGASSFSGASDSFVMSLDANTNINFLSYLGGTGGEDSNIALEVENGIAHLLVLTSSTDFPITNGTLVDGDSDYVYVQLDAAGSIAASGSIHTPGAEDDAGKQPMDIVDGEAYILITTESSDAPVTNGSTISGDEDMLYVHMNSNANIVFATYLGGSASENAHGIQVDSGVVHILGTSSASDYLVTNGSYQSGSIDMVYTKMDPMGNIEYSTYLGGEGAEQANTLLVENGNALVAGSTRSFAFPVTNSTSYNAASGNTTDIIYTSLELCGNNYDLGTGLVSPASQTVCQLGLVGIVEADEVTASSDALPQLFVNGVATSQVPVEASYQWQEAPSPTGPWADVAGAVLSSFSPPPSSTDAYYRRVATNSKCCGGGIVATSEVTAVLVTEDIAPEADAGGVFNTCPGTAVTLGGVSTAIGGTAPYTYEWDYGAANVANPTVTPTENTIYTVTVTDANGCQQIDQALVNTYIADAGVASNNCAGDPVQIGASPIPGVSGVQYSWSPVTGLSCSDCAQPMANPGSSTTYTLTLTIPVTGGGTCQTTDTVEVNPIPAPSTTEFAGPDVVICLGDTAPIGTGADPGFTYTWAPGNYLPANTQAVATFTPGSLEMPSPNPITYFLTARNESCTYVDQMEAAVIEARAGEDGCGPRIIGEPDRTPDIDETYTWVLLSGPGNFTGVTNQPQVPVSGSDSEPSVYQLTVSYNGHSCVDEVIVPPCGCSVGIEFTAPFGCPDFGLNNGQVALTATPADNSVPDASQLNFTWSPAEGLSATTGQTVYLTDDVERTYTVTMSSPHNSSFNCSSSIEVNPPAWSLPVFTSEDQSTCSGEPVQIGDAPVAGYSYEWSGQVLSNNTVSNPIATATSTTEYTVLVTDILSGCTVRDTTIVEILNTQADAGEDHLVCDNGIIQLGGSPAAPNTSYSWTPSNANWQNGSNEFDAEPEALVAISTTFILTATDDILGCATQDTVEVVVADPVPAFELPELNYCPSSGPLTIGEEVPQGLTYNWVPASLLDDATARSPQVLNPPSTPTTFILNVNNAAGCASIVTQTIVPANEAPEPGTNVVMCLGEVAALGSSANPTGAGISYSWSPATGLDNPISPNPNFEPTETGAYTFTLSKTEDGCTSTASINVTVNELSLPALSSTTVCEGSCVQIGTEAQFGVEYFWSPTTGLNDANASIVTACVSETTTYTLTAVGANGCIASREVTVGVNPVPAPEVTVPMLEACLGDTGLTLDPQITPTGNYSFVWGPNDGTLSDIYSSNPTIYLTGIGTKSYELLVTDLETGCSTSAVAEVQVELCQPCSVVITNVTVGTCNYNDPNSESLVDVEVIWAEAPEGETLEVSIGSSVVTIDPTTTSSPANVQFLVSADASVANPISAEFTGGTCGDSDFFNAPPDCEPEHIFDLALSKVIDLDATPGPFAPGSLVTFEIEVLNQGTVDATEIQISDYIPSGLGLNDANWTASSGVATLNTPITSLAAGGSTTVAISFIIDSNFSGTNLVNEAEISAASNDFGLPDIDSTADANSGNDAGGNPESPSDNSVDGDGTGVADDSIAATDEDDADPALVQVSQVFDLALTKVLDVTATPGPFAPGTAVTFEIEVYNQGSLAASNITISDYIPSGLILNDSAWSAVGSVASLNSPIASLAPGASIKLSVSFTIDSGFTGSSIVNVAEISSGENVLGLDDVDSAPDTDMSNDAGGAVGTLSDNSINGNGTGTPEDTNAATDEDDADPVEIPVLQTFDLALIKQIDTSLSPGPYLPGSSLSFLIDITNQGTLNATDIQISDYIPAGLILNDSQWSATAGIATLNTPIASLAAGASTQVSITFTIDSNYQGSTLVNTAEISEASNEAGLPDIDSQADANPNNDAGGSPEGASDNVTVGDGTGVPNDNEPLSDEDDADPALVNVQQEFDLALTKVLDTASTPGPFSPGDAVTFLITVYNQGSLDATMVQVSDYTPTSLTLNDAAWSSVAGIAMLNEPISSIPVGGSTTVSISYIIDATAPNGSMVNVAEISAAENALGKSDKDSVPDATNGNDAGGDPLADSDNEVDGDGTGIPGGSVGITDEDDADPELIEIFDCSFDFGTAPLQLCSGDCISLPIDIADADLSSAEIIWLPETNLDLSDPANAIYCGLENATYTVSVTLSNGCSASSSIELEVLSTPPVSISGETSVCASGSPITITATAGYQNYQWFLENPNGDDPLLQTGNSEVYSVTAQGNYYVVVDDGGACPGTSTAWTVTEDPCYACLGDNTWIDCNSNGLLEDGETMLGGVQVSLYNATGDFIGSEITNASGYYLFDDILPNDSYYLIFSAPTGLTISTSAGLLGDADNNDADANGQTALISLSDNECNYDVDAGFYPGELPGIDESNFPVICEGDQLELCVTENWPSYQWYQAVDPLSPDPVNDQLMAGETMRCYEPTETGSYYAMTGSAFCDVITPTVDVIVNPLPEASINLVGAAEFCESDFVTLQASPGGADNYDFLLNGSTLVQTGVNDSYVATEAGDYSVIVTDANGCSANSPEVAITVNANPEPGFTLDGPSTFCEPGDIRVTVDPGYDNYDWYLDGVLVQSGTTDFYDISATALVTVEVTDGLGCIGFMEEIEVNVLPQPEPFIYPNGPSTFCEGEEVLLSIIGAYSMYQWYLDGVAIPGAIASIYTASEAGNYTVFVDDLNGCSGTTAPFPITVNAGPSPMITAPLGLQVCEDSVPLFLEANAGFDDYKWYYNGVLLVQSAASNVYEANLAGVYTVEVLDANGCSGTSTAVQVQIDPLPVVDIDVTESAICEGESTQLLAAGGGTYNWIPNDGTLSCANCANPVANPLTTTYYTVEVVDVNGCVNLAQKLITVYPAPKPGIAIEAAEICEGESTLIEATPGFVSYEFYLDGIIVQSGALNELTATQAGDYSVLVSSEEDCEGLSDIVSLTINPLPNPVLGAASANPVCVGSSVHLEVTAGYESYQWFVDGELIPLETSNQLEAEKAGIYTVSVLDTESCAATSNTIEVEVNEKPEPQILVQGSSSVCPGEEVVLNVSGGFLSIQWYLDGNMLIGENSPVLLATVPGDYTAEVVSADGCAGLSEMVNVTNEQTVIPQVLIDGENPVCEGETVNLSLNGTDYYQVTWYLDGIEVQSGFQANLETAVPGNYWAVVEDNSGCTANTASIELETKSCDFDLALQKTLAPTQSENVATGEAVDFAITLINQGDIDAYDIEIVDYIPTGFVLTDSDWQSIGGNATYQLPFLAAGSSSTIEITLTVTTASEAGALINFAEISSAAAEDGTIGNDIDSTPDQDDSNDAGGNPGTGSDDSISGDGTGISGDSSGTGDEDDHDPAEVNVEIFDLALVKTLALGQQSTVSGSEAVTFTIEIFNQGNVAASNISIVDYIPTGLILNDTNWNMSGNYATTTIPGPLASGDTETVDITFSIDPDFAGGTIVNFAEIADARDSEGNIVSDVDSDMDSNDTNDAGGAPDSAADDSIDGDGSGTPGDTGDVGDEDDHDPALINVKVFDLALAKTLASGQSANVLPGQIVTYTIQIINQGSVPATNVEIIDYLPAGMSLADADWTEQGNTASTVIPGPIAPFGGYAAVDISVRIDEGVTAGDLVNFAEIANAQDDEGNTAIDKDSTPDSNPDNDAGGAPDSPADNETEGNGTGEIAGADDAGDEDDHDPELVTLDPVFDLALVKRLATGQPSIVSSGDEVTFSISVTNQGNITAMNVEVTDYIPSGMQLNDPDWTAVGSNASILLPGPIMPGETLSVDISLTALSVGELVNVAEISAAQDEEGNQATDIDSTADSDSSNDGGGSVGSPSDNSLDGNATGAPGDTSPTTDEDDSDPAMVTVGEQFDLALSKTLAEGQAQSVNLGDQVTYTITVYNQGNVDAYNIELIDYLPQGLVLSDSNWTSTGQVATTVLAGPIAAGSSASVDITVTVIATSGTLVNYAEITDAENANGDHPEDIDSTPDAIDGNDAGGDPTTSTNDETNGNGTGEPGGSDPLTDEDDHDPEIVIVSEVFDLALIKQLASGQSATVNPGDDVDFVISIQNQGNIDAHNVVIIDYIPEGFSLNDSDWTIAGEHAMITIPGPIAAGATANVEITLTAGAEAGTAVNVAEIVSAEDDQGGNPIDEDSTPDTDPNNDAGGAVDTTADDATGGDGTGAPGSDDPVGDEDDSDPASVTINSNEVFDLALIKTLAPEQSADLQAGDEVSFSITVYNQGSIDAYDVQIVDYIPEGLQLADGDWTLTGDNAYTVIPGPLMAGLSTTVEITFIITGSSEHMVNIAEIADAKDENGNDIQDVDSNADNIPDNDAGGQPDGTTDDEVNGNGQGSPNEDNPMTDEDDSDPETLTLQGFDLALIKQLADGQTPIVAAGDEVTFTITIYNQGTEQVQNVELIDYLPTGMSLNDQDWNAQGNTATITIPGPIAPDTSANVDITVVVSGEAGTLTNIAEIMDFEDEFGNHPPDQDSNPNANPQDDGPVSDDVTDSSNNDEDDHDPATVTISEQEVFDLALIKTLAAAQDPTVATGEQVEFAITIYNQGTVDAYNVEIVDYIPQGLQVDDPAWSVLGTTATYNIPGPITAGGSETIFINMTVTGTSDNMLNVAEIASAEDQNGAQPLDVDSTPDTDMNNDAGGDPNGNSDDAIDGNGGGQPGGDDPLTDEDDSDPAIVQLDNFDLALTKTLAAGQSTTVMVGDLVEYDITVYNQGTVAAYEIEIIDYIPTGLQLQDSNWFSADGSTATATIAGPVAAGQSHTISVTMLVVSGQGGLSNVAEIADAQDEFGSHPDDKDSTADSDPSNDAGGNPDDETNDAIDGDGTGLPDDGHPAGDEDDSDPEQIFIQEDFDLALLKSLAAEQSANVKTGDEVTFVITVYNQGTVIATNVEIVDYIPAGLSLIDPDWTEANGMANYTLTGPIPAGGSGIVPITFLVTGTSGSITNQAEIADAQDENGNHPEDLDSDADTDPNNDAPQTDGVIDGSNDDEDDSDPETIVISDDQFDLAMIKQLHGAQNPSAAPGDLVTYTITVYNQGSIDAYNIEISDYIPMGMSLADPDWTLEGDLAVKTIPGPIIAGSQTTMDVTMRIDDDFLGSTIVNFAEISSAEDPQGNPATDADSSPDTKPDNDAGGTADSESDDSVDGDGTGNPDDTNPETDEDDSDPASIEVERFDLALTKTLANGQAASVQTGDQVTYLITVYNQGTVSAYNIDLIDYVPEGLTLTDNDWEALITGHAVTTIPGPLAAGDSAAIPVTFTVTATEGVITNLAEITNAEDQDGNPHTDLDSSPDNIPDNDAGGNPDADSNDEIDGDGTGTPGAEDSATDEDDSDPETITVIDESFDLALIKQLAPNQQATVAAGDAITFSITVLNQGSIDAYNIQVVDYIPQGLMLADTDWSMENGQAITSIPGPLPAGASTSIDITFLVMEEASGTIVNTAEITDAEDEDGQNPSDEDSTPDSNPDNDAGGSPETNDTVDGDGTGTPGGDDPATDEDDSDHETFTVEEEPNEDNFDLALIKKLAANQAPVVQPGDQITFSIQVFNQGSTDAYNVEIIDYIPEGLMLADTDWSMANGNAVTSIEGPIVAGSSAELNITFIVMPGSTGTRLNLAEISDAQDENGDHPTDEDSTPDSNPDNDAGGSPDTDDVVDGDGTGTPGGDDPATDEDDSDHEEFTVTDEDVFDLALIKGLEDGQSALVAPGEEITYTITVYNQGTMPAYNVQVIDYLPLAFDMIDSDWALVEGNAVTIIPGPIQPGGAAMVPITLLVNEIAIQGNLRNIAEITNATDVDGNPQPDIDSTPDDDIGNDGDVKDDTIDGSDNDEDDHDSETVEVVKEIADVSLTKTVNNQQPANGEQIVYTITVNNHGPSAASGIVVNDLLPQGVQFLTASSADYDRETGDWRVGLLQDGQSASLDITALVTAYTGTIYNQAEVTETDQIDPDSTPDNMHPDPEFPDTEDDEDSVPFTVQEDEIPYVDLTLTKLVSNTTPSPEDLIIYSITVTNEGTATATGVIASDPLPAGLEYAGASNSNYDPSTGDWYIGELPAGESVTLDILVEVQASEGNIINHAQVIDTDQEDIDSTPDNGSPTDAPENREDDEDIAIISLSDCPLAVNYEVLCDTEGEFYTVIVALSEMADVSGDYTATNSEGFVLGPNPSGTPFNFTVIAADGCTHTVSETPAECIKLAVDLITFEGQIMAQGNLLSWITASEVNSAYYTLSRSQDGVNFTPIHQKQAQGNSNSELRYEFHDPYTLAGTVYYSLSETDLDGTTQHLGIISLSREAESRDLITLSPQPANDWMDVAFNYDIEELINVKLYDASGKLIFFKSCEAIVGTNSFRIDMSHFSQGVYFLMLGDGDQAIIEKVIKQ